ncbi:nuclear pore membrane glycoprotein 210-like [Uloborus diversus]|uniref:nuclear pore membrane glycoprotein 210-like n=1 Tax=Uloborus diversus TaxID=327109 RepID=UPI0024092969|nr:nuclear pore membrane glycoprotein 210-like [Uloborus diversus]
MKTYTVAVEMYDSDNHLIHLSDYIRVVLTFPKKLFHVNFTTANGTYCNVQALVPGKGKIRAELKGVIERGDLISSKDILVATTEEVSVLQKIVIFPPDTFLPYERSIMPHKVLLKVTGGSGEYICAVSDSTVASIAVVSDTPYTVEVHVKNVTNLVVTITDRINLNNIAFAKISVQLVSDIEVYPTVVEAEVNNFVVLPVALVGNDGSKAGSSRKFDDCSQTRPIVEIIEKHILNHTYDSQVPSYGKGCMNLVFECKYPGYSRVNIMYQSNENTTNNTTFKTTTVMACFKRLTAVHPVRVAVLALGTSKEVAFEGGPRKWPLFKDGHFTKLEPANDGLLDISLIKDPVRYNKDLTVFRVLCKGLGESDLTFKIGNVQSATNPHPAQSEAQIKIFCSEPSTIHLKNAVNTVGKKLKDESIVKVPFYGDKGFSVDVWLKDSVGRKFANISVFEIEWEVSDKTLAEPNDGLSTHENAVAGYRKITRDFKEFKLKGGTGKLEVRAKVLKYKSDYLSKEGIVKYKNIKEISNSIVLNLVSLRDIHDNLYATDATDNKEKQEGGHCDKDSC